ncbi:aminoglycoside phosphotransferase family protein [Kribbella sp. NBC_01245]|uniref:phosphotransferase n=1 Tax=Kribbella sp. NBC_01245 TaxID=2903578 RepID=UPI002E28C8E7|nr:phosphotransferase [Kribbella sp. NBC_01245]
MANSTHTIEVDGSIVRKHYRSWERGEPDREWTTLTLLAAHAPGLSPLPLRRTTEAPGLEMTRVPGEPLLAARGATAIGALSLAIRRLHSAIPRRILDELPLRIGHAGEMHDLLRDRFAVPRPMPDPDVRRAVEDGRTWLASRAPALLATADALPVFGHGDPNLANYHWDGERVRVLDFEEAGRSDLAYELADAVEHLAGRTHGDLDEPALLAEFDLTSVERARLHEARRLLSLFWLDMLLPGRPAHSRNPPGTLEAQAARVLALFDAES